LTKAEDALQGIADTLGLSAEEGSLLLSVLKEIGLWNQQETNYSLQDENNYTGAVTVDQTKSEQRSLRPQQYLSTEVITQKV